MSPKMEDPCTAANKITSLAVPKLICRNVGLAVAGNHAQACHTAGVRRYQPANE
jgi:hypothetical protein